MKLLILGGINSHSANALLSIRLQTRPIEAGTIPNGFVRRGLFACRAAHFPLGTHELHALQPAKLNTSPGELDLDPPA